MFAGRRCWGWWWWEVLCLHGDCSTPDPQVLIHATPELCYMLSLSWCYQFLLIHLFLRAEKASHTIMLLPLCLTVGRSLHLSPLNLNLVCCQTAYSGTHQCTLHNTNFFLTIFLLFVWKFCNFADYFSHLAPDFCCCSARTFSFWDVRHFPWGISLVLGLKHFRMLHLFIFFLPVHFSFHDHRKYTQLYTECFKCPLSRYVSRESEKRNVKQQGQTSRWEGKNKLSFIILFVFYTVANFWATNWTFREFHHSVDQLWLCSQEHHSWIFYWTFLYNSHSLAVFIKAWRGKQVPEWKCPRNSKPNLPRLYFKAADKFVWPNASLTGFLEAISVALNFICYSSRRKKKKK